MPADGIPRLFVATVATIGGSILLSAVALLALEQQSFSNAQPPPVAVTSTPVAEGTPAETPVAPTGEPSTASAGADPADPEATAASESAMGPAPTSAALSVADGSPTTTPTAVPSTEPPPVEAQYVVVRGDALELIAARFGVPLVTIAAANNLQPPYSLEVGQVLLIPSGP